MQLWGSPNTASNNPEAARFGVRLAEGYIELRFTVDDCAYNALGFL
ncbi:unnamed protein product [Acidithrix sp. C25]|nr:unnamed protein product [Acidithrix sp. C25]